MMEMIELTVKDAVLQALEQARGTRLSGGWLAEQLGVSRAAVHKAIAALRESGLAIDAVTGEGYRLASDDDSLTAAGINALLDTAVIGREILVEPSLTSSNTTMKEQYLGRRHGFTLFAEEQTGGRGRLGRTFVSPADTGVYYDHSAASDTAAVAPVIRHHFGGDRGRARH
ncbi:MAG: biotin operon repressor [Butyricicoccus sp.]